MRLAMIALLFAASSVIAAQAPPHPHSSSAIEFAVSAGGTFYRRVSRVDAVAESRRITC